MKMVSMFVPSEGKHGKHSGLDAKVNGHSKHFRRVHKKKGEGEHLRFMSRVEGGQF